MRLSPPQAPFSRMQATQAGKLHWGGKGGKFCSFEVLQAEPAEGTGAGSGAGTGAGANAGARGEYVRLMSVGNKKKGWCVRYGGEDSSRWATNAHAHASRTHHIPRITHTTQNNNNVTHACRCDARGGWGALPCSLASLLTADGPSKVGFLTQALTQSHTRTHKHTHAQTHLRLRVYTYTNTHTCTHSYAHERANTRVDIAPQTGPRDSPAR